MLHSQGDKTPEMTLLKNQYKGVNSLREVHTGSLTGKTLSRRKERHEKLLNHIFIDGLSGMALGLFSTLIVGTIIQQIGNLIGGNIGDMLLSWERWQQR